MYVVTNRNLQENEPPENRFGISFHKDGPGMLRLAEANKIGDRWQIEVFDDYVEYENQRMLASEVAFLKTQKKMSTDKKNCLIYCHGYNTDFEAALEAAYRIEQTYGTEIVLFTWPSDGIFLNYLSDKDQAKESFLAFDRFFEKLQAYIIKHRDKSCGQKINLALLSMGNYLLEILVESSAYQGETNYLDNILLLSADVNNPAHSQWVDKIELRNRLFITINENDFALDFSDSKPGREQKARLGNTIRNLTSANALYVNFTKAQHVGNSHNYFTDPEVLANQNIRRFFQVALNGGAAEDGLSYDNGIGAYVMP